LSSKQPSEDLVITGCGGISPWGNRYEDIFKATEGPASVPIVKNLRFGTVNDFDAAAKLGKSGLKVMNRATRFGIGAALDCLADARLETAEIGGEIGVVIGSHLGHMDDVEEMIRTILEEGSYALSPLKAGNGGINVMAATIGMRIGARALNTTIHNSYTSGLDAVQYACRSLSNHYAPYILAGGVESASRYCMEWHRINGSRLAFEGAGVILLEKRHTALDRGVKPLGVIKAYSSRPYSGPDSISQSLAATLKSANLGMEAVDVFVGAGDGCGEPAEEQSLFELGFGGSRLSVRESMGEGLAVTGIFQIMLGVNLLQKGCRNVLIHLYAGTGGTATILLSLSDPK
jgi:3-oxoacyl-(acyl-carrier-protein) synthase